MKLLQFLEDYQLESFDDPTYQHEARLLDILSGLAIHGYMDEKNNLRYLQKSQDMLPNKFLMYTETSCCRCIVLYENKYIVSLNITHFHNFQFLMQLALLSWVVGNVESHMRLV